MDKRDRGRNYTEKEKEQFMQIILRYKTVVENRKIDRINIQEKNYAWMAIANEFNAIQTTGVRDLKALKTLLENLKMKAKREKSEDRKQINASGGCSSCSPTISNSVTREFSELVDRLTNPLDSSSNHCQEGDIEIDPDPLEVVICQSRERPISPAKEILVVPDIPEFQGKTDNITYNENLDSVTQVANKKRKMYDVYEKLEEISTNRKEQYSNKIKKLDEEHSLRMEILRIEKATAEIKFKNAQKKEKVLDLKLKKLQG
ncbi:uncharacterized protein LOC111053259 [Nilaparvata lugens]|uniref:uncharacterized protein LOC111053259 n=1 Tax=Nilaparvata lugens TaxID=108931 RepID=UPI00193D25FE|nr:uncharacterized protein LOC111053259 [Nilaparvata lugens]